MNKRLIQCLTLLVVLMLATGTPVVAQPADGPVGTPGNGGGGPGGGGPGGGGPGGGGGGGGGKSKVDHKAAQNLPIQLGTSGGNENDWVSDGLFVSCSSGTLGALLTDTGGNLFILSNTHVFVRDPQQAAYLAESVGQPGLIDANCAPSNTLPVGTLASGSSMATTTTGPPPNNYPRPDSNVDAAVASTSSTEVMADGSILGIGAISNQVMTPVEALGQPVTKSGRTTGNTSSTVDGINATISVGYSAPLGGGSGFTREFTGQILVKNRRNKFLNSGDSGSLAVHGETLQPVGLLYAGSSSIAVANPAQDVLDYFVYSAGRVSGASGDLSFVGGPPVGSASSTQSASVARAVEVQQANAARLRSVPRGVGHAVSSQNGVGVIKVLVEEITPETRQAVPTQLDGVPVVLEAVGRIVAY